MSLRLAFLAFLTAGDKHGYELKAEFEELFRGLWDVNAGQIYTTLSRMQRDGLVTNERVSQNDRPDKKTYTLTEAGKQEISQWMSQAIQEAENPRDELLVKVFVLNKLNPALAVTAIREQRKFYFASLRELTRLRLNSTDTFKRLILDRALLRVQADLEWLEICENTLQDSDPLTNSNGGNRG